MKVLAELRRILLAVSILLLLYNPKYGIFPLILYLFLLVLSVWFERRERGEGLP